MARGISYLVFILPIIFSVGFGAVVMINILDEPDRELNMWPIDFSEFMRSQDIPIEIVGMKHQYIISSPIHIQIQITDLTQDCGDLYITILSAESKDIVSQRGFFEQCYGNDGILPIGEQYSEILENPGNYEIIAEISDKNQQNTISISKEFSVK